MLAIRLARVGAKKKPAYRVVVIEKSRARNSSSLEIVGHYNPTKDPILLSLKRERIDYWVGHGAQPSKTVARLMRYEPPEPTVVEEKPVEAAASVPTEQTTLAAEAPAAEATVAEAPAAKAPAEEPAAEAQATEPAPEPEAAEAPTEPPAEEPAAAEEQAEAAASQQPDAEAPASDSGSAESEPPAEAEAAAEEPKPEA